MYLQRFERGDMIDRYFEWFNDLEVTRHMVNGAVPNRPADVEAFFDQMSRSADDVVFAIVGRATETPGGNAAIHQIDWSRRLSEFGIILNLNRVWLGVHVEHVAAVRAYEKVMFKMGSWRVGLGPLQKGSGP